MDSWSSYNAIQAGEILPDPVHHTVESSERAPRLTGQWVQRSLSFTDLSESCEDPGQSPGQEAWGDYELMYMSCVSMCLCVCICVCICLYLCLCVIDEICMFICVSVYMCLLVCFQVSVCLSVSLWMVYMFV